MSAALSRMDERALALVAESREALVVPFRPFVAPETVGVGGAGPGVVESDESRPCVLSVALDDPRHQLAVELVARESEELVHLLEQDDLPEGERELVVDVVAAEAWRTLQTAAEPDPLRPVREKWAYP